MSGKLYIDQDHNAFGLIEDDKRGIVTVDHGFHTEDFDRVLAVLERYEGVPRFVEDGVAFWECSTHRKVVLSSLHEALRLAGYSSDPLSSRSVVEVEDPKTYDHNTHREVRVTETVERGLRSHIDMALSVLHERGDVQMVGITHTARTRTDVLGRPLPLARARLRLARPAESAAEVRSALREALRPVSGYLVRASVDEVEGGFDIEVALAPGRDAVSDFVRSSTPTFESGPIRGVRTAKFVLEAVPPNGALSVLEGRAAACTAATSIAHPNGRTVVVRVPCSMIEGSSAADNAFGQRLAWLHRQMEEWGAELIHVGGVEAVLVPESHVEALRLLNEVPKRPLAVTPPRA